MKTKFEILVLSRQKGLKAPLAKVPIPGKLPDVFREATLTLKAIGAKVVEAYNVEEPKGMVIQDPSLPVYVFLAGASLTDDKGLHLSAEESKTGLSNLIPEIEV